MKPSVYVCGCFLDFRRARTRATEADILPDGVVEQDGFLSNNGNVGAQIVRAHRSYASFLPHLRSKWLLRWDQNRKRRLAMDVFPEPVRPTRATICPGWIVRLMLWRTVFSP